MNIRTRAAQIRSRWLRMGLQCKLSLDELEPLFSVYAEIPRGKLVIVDKTQVITLKNLLSLSADEYNTYKLDIKARNQATVLHTTLSRFNQSVLVCSGQVKLATDLYSSQYLFSDSFGVNPPL
jgi:hypothetical protein